MLIDILLIIIFLITLQLIRGLFAYHYGMKKYTLINPFSDNFSEQNEIGRKYTVNMFWFKWHRTPWGLYNDFKKEIEEIKDDED